MGRCLVARPVKQRSPRRSRFRRKAEPWTRRELARLGKSADSKLARRNRRTIQETVAEREARRIALPLRLVDGRRKKFGIEIGRRLNRSVMSVGHKRKQLRIYFVPPARPWTKAEDAVLGKASDREIAKNSAAPIPASPCGGGDSAYRRATRRIGTGPGRKNAC